MSSDPTSEIMDTSKLKSHSIARLLYLPLLIYGESVVTNHPSTFISASRSPKGVNSLAFTALPTVVCILALVVGAPSAIASKQLVDRFGSESGRGTKGGEFSLAAGVAVNESGAGPAPAGDIYVVDAESNRVQRFHRNDNGTSADAGDDTYEFVSAWGAGVEGGGTNYEICTSVPDCKAAQASGGNGTAAGNGDLDEPWDIAVDQDTGEVYVTDVGNHRVNVYAGDGTFLRSFGYDVTESGPGDVSGPNEEQLLTVKATGGKFSLLFNGQTTGATGTGQVRKGSSTVTSVEATAGTFVVGQAFSAFGGLAHDIPLFPRGTTITAVNANSLTLSKAAIELGQSLSQTLFGDGLSYNASAAEVQSALNALPSVGGVGGSVTVSGGPGDLTGSSPYAIGFNGSLGDTDISSLGASSGGLTIDSGAPLATLIESRKGGAYEVCEAASGDICQAGSAGNAVGELGQSRSSSNRTRIGISLTPPDGNPASGTVFVADAANHRIDTFSLSGFSPSSFGSSVFSSAPGMEMPTAVAVDSRGIVYAPNIVVNPEGKVESEGISRYDSENADGNGIGFVDPIPVGENEHQQLTVSATAGEFRLSFEGDTTTDIPFDATPEEVQLALEALPSIGSNGVFVAGASQDYPIRFVGPHLVSNQKQITVSNGTNPLSGGSGASIETVAQGRPGLVPTSSDPTHTWDLAVEPDSDGAGPNGDILYVLRQSGNDNPVQQFGPINAPGLSTPPMASDELHGTIPRLTDYSAGLAVEAPTRRIYVSDLYSPGFVEAPGVYVLGEGGGGDASASLDSISNITATSAVVHGTIDPNGPPATRYHLEYSLDDSNWTSLPYTSIGGGAKEITVSLSPPAGLQPHTLYHVRLVVSKLFSQTINTPELTFTTLSSPPLAETTGAPVRTTTTAQLGGRVTPSNTATSYYFEYGAQGPCDAHPCAQTDTRLAGSGNLTELISEEIEGLEPDTVYHYRLVADNGNPGSPAFGADIVVKTRKSDASLFHGHFPGPPGSDRAYEQVSPADTSGNPVGEVVGTSAAGDRVLFTIAGGNDLSDTGNLFTPFFSERHEDLPHRGGWQTKSILPPRTEVSGVPQWKQLADAGITAALAGDLIFGAEKISLWRLDPEGQPQLLFEGASTEYSPEDFGLISSDGSRIVVDLGGIQDPAHPAPGVNAYEMTPAGPRLAGVLPGGSISPCGSRGASLSDNGSLLFFISSGNSCGGAAKLFLRNFVTAETKLLSGRPISGPECAARFLSGSPDAVFFWTQSRLTVEDNAPVSCGDLNGDVYRYDLDDGTLDCVTCLAPGFDVEVYGNLGAGGPKEVTQVAKNGTRLYFQSPVSLVRGAPEGKEVLNTYRLNLQTGTLAFVGGPGLSLLNARLNDDGTVVLLKSSASFLNSVNSDNGGTSQYYRYDDRDRSITCISCPQNGSAPRSAVGLNSGYYLSESGEDLAFASPTPLVFADQNTAAVAENPERGADVYEWRDGNLLLITDGLTNWTPTATPSPAGLSVDGRDLFFTAAAQYTPDALDGYIRLYDARIGGGFEFSSPPPPCPLEVCQGTPRGVPDEEPPGTGNFAGPGNIPSRPPKCRKFKMKHKDRCVTTRNHRKRAHRRAAKHDRRTER